MYVGIAGGESGVRGQFGAYDAKTGKEVWKFYTIPGPGEFGHDTWEGDSWMRGGGPLWTHPAIDPDLGLVYLPVGNAYPDTDGSTRGGDNLFTVSIVALDLKTGVRKWHFQEVHHDIWDYDNQTPPVLADVRYQGQPRKILIHGGKTGIDVHPRSHRRPAAHRHRGAAGAAGAAAEDGEDAAVSDRRLDRADVSRTRKRRARLARRLPLRRLLGRQSGRDDAGHAGWTQLGADDVQPADESRLRARARSSTPGLVRATSRPPGQPRSGILAAIDPTTNKIVWQKRTKFPLGTGSGLLSTASGLIFHGESDGHIVAYDISNGDVLWKFQTGAGADAPVATYEVGGEQYVAILAGGNPFQLSAPRRLSLGVQAGR